MVELVHQMKRILSVPAMWDLQAQHVNQVILNVLVMCGIHRYNI